VKTQLAVNFAAVRLVCLLMMLKISSESDKNFSQKLHSNPDDTFRRPCVCVRMCIMSH